MLIEPPLTTDQIHEIILEICESQETNLAYSHHIKNLTRHITFREKELNQAKAETRLYKDRTSFELVSDLQQLTQQLATAIAERDAWKDSSRNLSYLLRQILYARNPLGTKICDELERWSVDDLHENFVKAIERNDDLTQRCSIATKQESLTILCAKLDNALRCANNCYCGDSYGQKVIDEALTHYAELLKKKE